MIEGYGNGDGIERIEGSDKQYGRIKTSKPL